MRVIDIIKEYEKQHGHTFSVWHKMRAGAVIKQQFLLTHPNESLPLKESKEPQGTFKVPDYPDTFVSRMSSIIYDFAELINLEKTKKVSRGKTEKPAQKATLQTPNPEPKKQRIRKRIPLQKPAFTGNKFK